MKSFDAIRGAFTIFVAAIAVGCSAARQPSTSARCEIAPADSVLLKAGRLYTECSVDQRATAIQKRINPTSTMPPISSRGGACMRAEVQLVVGVDGLPERGTPKLISGNYPEFSNLVMSSVDTWRYRPATVNGQPVRQLVREKVAVAVAVVKVRAGEAPTRPPPPSNCP